MSQRALTLKYRPQVFTDLVGQDHVTRVLERALETNRVAHAFLFTGARGVGKTTSARILAKALNCQQRASGEIKGANPCNVCTSCTEITTGVSLDVAEIDGASNRGIADVQALREKVRFTPTGGKYRVVIIDEVHQLSNDAFAALLKTLEEPPAHLVFIFATTDPQKVPDTIRSRTQRYDYARVPVRRGADRLLEIREREMKDPEGVHFTLSEGAALLMAQKSEGSMRDAVSALDQCVSAGEANIDEALVRRVLGIADRESFFDIAQAIVSRDPKESLRALHRAFDKGIDPRDLAEGLSEHIRHVLILKVDPEGADLVAASHEDLERLKAQGNGWSENDLLRLLRLISESVWPMRDSSQPLVHLEAAVLQMATLEPGETLAELLGRLEALEKTFGGGGSGPSGGGIARPATAAAPAPAASRPMASAPAVRPAAPPPSAAPPSSAAPPRPAPPAASAAPPQSSIASTARAISGIAARRGPPPAAPPSARAPENTQRVSPSAVAPQPAAVALADGALDLGAAVLECWRAALVAIHERKRLLGAFLEESHCLGLVGDRLHVAMDDLHRAVIEEKDNRQIVSEELRRAFGAAVTLQWAPLEDAPPEAQRPSEKETQVMVAKTLEWFGGEAPPAGSSERTDA